MISVILGACMFSDSGFVTCPSVRVISLLTHRALVWSMLLILRGIRIPALPESAALDVCVLLSLKATLHFLTVHSDQPDLKLGSHFMRAALTITAARLCVLIRGARDTFAVVAPAVSRQLASVEELCFS